MCAIVGSVCLSSTLLSSCLQGGKLLVACIHGVELWWMEKGLVALQRKLLMPTVCKRELGTKLMIKKINVARLQEESSNQMPVLF